MRSFRDFEEAVFNRKEGYIPLYEHGVDLPIIEKIMGFDFSEYDFSTMSGRLGVWSKIIQFYDQMGYLYVPVELRPDFAPMQYQVASDRGWVNEQTGPIQSWEDLNNPEHWPPIEKAFDYELFRQIGELVPGHMKIIGGASGGPFEHASFLMGLESLCIIVYQDPEFASALFAKIGTTLAGIAQHLVQQDTLGAYRFGDDLGFKTATMFSPSMLREYVFPWQKRVVQVVHTGGRCFVLHSCGQLEMVMDDLIDDVGIDGKHSFEDATLPVTEAKDRWGSKIAILGGIDVDFLCRSTPHAIKEYTKRVVEQCAQGGGYAAGSGNTIASYVPVENYLAMVEAVNELNGRTG